MMVSGFKEYAKARESGRGYQWIICMSEIGRKIELMGMVLTLGQMVITLKFNF